MVMVANFIEKSVPKHLEQWFWVHLLKYDENASLNKEYELNLLAKFRQEAKLDFYKDSYKPREAKKFI